MDGIELLNKGYKDSYYEGKKSDGYIFTKDRIKNDGDTTPCAVPDGISWWSKKFCRYRTSKEQSEFTRKKFCHYRTSKEQSEFTQSNLKPIE